MHYAVICKNGIKKILTGSNCDLLTLSLSREVKNGNWECGLNVAEWTALAYIVRLYYNESKME